MATKTVLKLLLSKYAPLSVDMQKAVIMDQAVVNNYETVDAVHIDQQEELPEDKRVRLMIEDAACKEDLEKVKEFVKPEYQELFEEKLASLS